MGWVQGIGVCGDWAGPFIHSRASLTSATYLPLSSPAPVDASFNSSAACARPNKTSREESSYCRGAFSFRRFLSFARRRTVLRAMFLPPANERRWNSLSSSSQGLARDRTLIPVFLRVRRGNLFTERRLYSKRSRVPSRRSYQRLGVYGIAVKYGRSGVPRNTTGGISSGVGGCVVIATFPSAR